MATKPTPGGSDGTYGTELNAFLDVSLASDGKIADGAVFSTSAAPSVDAGVANKKYVDDNISPGDVPVSVDSDSQTMAKAHAYLAQTSGFVTAWMQTTDTNAIKGYVGTTNNPAGAGTQVAENRVSDGVGMNGFVSFYVPDGKYFELTQTTVVLTIIWTPYVTGGGNPIDQD